MGMLVDRCDELGRGRTQTVNRLRRLLLELFPGGAKKFLSAMQARALVATIKPRDVVGKTRRRLAVELIAELETIDKKIKAADRDLRELVIARGSTLLDLHGIGPSGAARLLADVGDIFSSAIPPLACLFRWEESGWQDPDGSDARPQTTVIERRLRPHARRPETT